MNKTKTHLPSAICALATCLCLTYIPTAGWAFGEPDVQLNNYTEGGDAVIQGILGQNEPDPGTPFGNPNPADDIPRLTNSSDASPAAQTYEESARCKNVYVNKAPNSPTVSDDDTVDNCPLPADPDGGSDQDPGRIPSTRDILYLATAVIHADGAGLHKRPTDVSYTNKYVPTIVAATHPTQTHTINLLGHDITITLTATNYQWSWGDDTPDLISTSPGTPWRKGMDPNTDPALIRHYYTPPGGWRSRFDGPYPNATRTITLTTTWAGTATNPFTGETQTINGLVTTTETTGPFPLSHLLISNTDTWEEKQGH